MPSLKAFLFSWYACLQLKRSFQSVNGLHARIQHERKTRDHRPPCHLRKVVMIEEREANGYPVYMVSPISKTASQARILYVHGGSYVFEIKSLHWDFVAILAERLGATVTVPIYPLGPSYQLPDIYAMLQPIHDDLAASHDPSPFWIAGDSAGGTMAVILTQQALIKKRQIASRLVLITPMVDATFTNPELHIAALSDPWLDVPGIREIIKLVSSNMAASDPRVSPVHGDLGELPPMMVFVAERDLLTPDTSRFVEMARERGREVELIVGKGMMHVWPLLPMREGREAVYQMIAWLEKAIPQPEVLSAI